MYPTMYITAYHRSAIGPMEKMAGGMCGYGITIRAANSKTPVETGSFQLRQSQTQSLVLATQPFQRVDSRAAVSDLEMQMRRQRRIGRARRADQLAFRNARSLRDGDVAE